jgi:hypothetical protein
MSTANEPRVENVSNELPQPQLTVAGRYSGWMPSFMTFSCCAASSLAAGGKGIGHVAHFPILSKQICDTA